MSAETISTKASKADSCQVCFKQCETLTCSACKAAWYCSRACQRKDWKSHRQQCRAVQKENRTKSDVNLRAHGNRIPVLNAMSELQALIGGMSVKEAAETFHRTNDELDRLHVQIRNEEDKLEQKSRMERIQSLVKIEEIHDEKVHLNKEIKARFFPTTSLLRNSISNDKQGENEEKRLGQDDTKASSPEHPSFLEDGHQNFGNWQFSIEKLIYISAFSLTLICPNKDEQFLVSCIQDIRISVSNVKKSEYGSAHTMLKISSVSSSKNEHQKMLAKIILPCAIVSTASEIMSTIRLDGNFISLRIQYHDPDQIHVDNIIPESTISSLTPTEALDNLQCKSCGQYMLKVPPSNLKQDEESREDSVVIRNVFHLPTGHWDEITDYLTCYDGQPSIDFSSVNNNPESGNVFEDEAILVMNRKDIKNICVLAIDGYGEQAKSPQPKEDIFNFTPNEDSTTQDLEITQDVKYRGNKDWRDAVGGATLTCNLCCSTLGYASTIEPDVYRLLKHRVQACCIVEGENVDHFMQNTCASFIGKELIRYSEMQAVFTFAVFGCQNSGAVDRCILLRVLSWNTSMAIRGSKYKGHLVFRRVVKVIYQEKDPASFKTSVANRDEHDPMKFHWGGVDLCCPPPKGQMTQGLNTKTPTRTQEATSEMIGNGSKASVNLYLSGDEWKELKDSLQERSNYFSASLSSVTAMLKLGNKGGADSQGDIGQPLLSFMAVS